MKHFWILSQCSLKLRRVDIKIQLFLTKSKNAKKAPSRNCFLSLILLCCRRNVVVCKIVLRLFFQNFYAEKDVFDVCVLLPKRFNCILETCLGI